MIVFLEDRTETTCIASQVSADDVMGELDPPGRDAV
jgi:hypothetical protein